MPIGIKSISKEWKDKISKSLIGHKHSKTTKKKISKVCTGKNHSTKKEKRVQEIVGIKEYANIHSLLKRIRGKASNYKCNDCGKKARDWSSNTEKYESIKEFVPRCKSCHLKYDYKLSKRKVVIICLQKK